MNALQSIFEKAYKEALCPLKTVYFEAENNVYFNRLLQNHEYIKSELENEWHIRHILPESISQEEVVNMYEKMFKEIILGEKIHYRIKILFHYDLVDPADMRFVCEAFSDNYFQYPSGHFAKVHFKHNL